MFSRANWLVLVSSQLSMPRVYNRKKPLEKWWTEGDLKIAVEEVWCKKSTISAGAKQYGIPRTILADHVHRRRLKVGAGRPTILTLQEEKEVVVTCRVLQRIWFRLTRDDIDRVVSKYLRDHPARAWQVL